MNYLSKKTTYLVGAIHTTRKHDFGVAWREEITPTIEKRYDVTVLNPCKMSLNGFGEISSDKGITYFKNLIKEKKYTQVKKEFYSIIRKDMKCVDKSDFIIFYYDPTVPTIGSMHEVVTAINQKTPVLVKCDEELLEHFNPWLLTLIKPQWLFTTWDEMWAYLDKIHTGELDTSWWW
jgi:hypothetical protein